MIGEDYSSYEVEKLLKENGFDGEIRTTFDKEGYTQPSITHQMAMKWLREVYDLHIVIYPYKRGKDGKGWCCKVYKTYNLLGQEIYTNETLNSYEEAVDVALKYCLEKIIK